jgi:alpha-glucoside transport system permease protein
MHLLTTSLDKLLSVVEAVGGFVAILAFLFWVAGKVRGRFEKPLANVLLLGPAVILLLVGLVIPAIRTIFLSFRGQYAIGPNVKYVGLANYKWAFTDPHTLHTLLRTAEWLVIVPVVSTVMGMIFSILVDRMRFQVIAKSLIFMPTAISFVGASLIWQYVYQYRSPGLPQIGLLSEVVMKLGWSHPPNWLLSAPLNTFLLMVILVWIETGFAMVILGAAIRSIPDDVIEAARVDGAKGWRLFRSVQLPMISTTVTVVVITIMTATLKIFDIVYTITGGDFKTDTLANEMYTQIFESFNTGRGSALAVILFMAVVPLVTVSIFRLRRERYA